MEDHSMKNRNYPGSSAKRGLWPRQRPEIQFFQRKFSYRRPLRGGTWAPSRGTWAVTLKANRDAVMLNVAKLSLGSVVQSGDELITLVPTDAPLQVEANVPARD